MANPTITKIVIHCSATQNGKQLRTTTQTAAQRIDDWHKQRGFQRLAGNYKQFNPHLQHIGSYGIQILENCNSVSIYEKKAR